MERALIKRWEMVELAVPANALGRVPFNTIPQLRNQPDQVIRIKNIEVFPAAVYSNSQNTPSIPGLPATDVAKAVLVLYVNGEESIRYVPLAKLIHTQDGTNAFQQDLQGFDDLENVAWDKSYVQFSVAGDATAYVIPFGVTYIRMMKNPQGDFVQQ
jgi:hypothetical protein